METKLKQIIIVNKDLKMGMGKIVGQALHGEVLYMEDVQEAARLLRENSRDNFEKNEKFFDNYNEWRDKSNGPIGEMRKIVKKVSEQEIRNIVDDLCRYEIKSYTVFDKGLTQVLPNSLTCLVIEPLEEYKCKELFGDLKLL